MADWISIHRATTLLRSTTLAIMSEKTYQSADGTFVRLDSTFRKFISNEAGAEYPAEKGRYALYLSPLCPWAHRTLIVRALKGLEDVVELYPLGDMGPEGWRFDGEHGSLSQDPIHGFETIRQLYRHADASFDGPYTIPVLWDQKTDTMVNNESSEIIRMLYSSFDHLLPEAQREVHRPGGGLYPDALRQDIDALNAWVYDTVNDGVYKTGFATSQAAYDAGVKAVFASLDRLEVLLAGHGKNFLLGDTLTEADVRLYTTVVRFDAAYVPVFLANLRTIRHDYPHLHAWLRRLYWDADSVKEQTRGAFHGTTSDFLDLYGPAYARARHRIVYKNQGPLIVPAGPSVKIEPM